jgi:aryl-alcohol dehydrogenase-like predicted oxidoreductase
LACVGKTMHRLGLACNYGINGRDVLYAFDRGLNLIFWTCQMHRARDAMREIARRHRDHVAIISMPLVAYSAGHVRFALRRTLQTLRTDYLDVLLLGWLGCASRGSSAVFDELVRLRDRGLVRAIGSSIHDRPRAGRLAADSPLDVLMIRYNAAHTGAEQDIFPHVSADRPSIIAYTATRWGRLLKPRKGWTERVPDAGDCYRFCLANPHVDAVWTGPKNRRQLAANIDAVERRPPMTGEELDWMRRWGCLVHG